MKRFILTILFSSLVALASGMTISKHIGYGPANFKVNFMWYAPEVQSKNVVLFLHGVGECGPADGSELMKVEVHGWPRYAKGVRPGETVSRGTVEYPFHIIAPQVVSSYSGLIKGIIPMLTYMGFENIIIAGISMGGYAVYDILSLTNDPLSKVIAFVDCCGSEGVANIPNMNKLPGLHWHGDKDPTVSYSGAKNFVDAYNAAGGQVTFYTLPGVGHNAWDHAFKSDASQDVSLAFVNKIFPIPKPVDDVNKTLDEIVNFIQSLKGQ